MLMARYILMRANARMNQIPHADGRCIQMNTSSCSVRGSPKCIRVLYKYIKMDMLVNVYVNGSTWRNMHLLVHSPMLRIPGNRVSSPIPVPMMFSNSSPTSRSPPWRPGGPAPSPPRGSSRSSWPSRRPGGMPESGCSFWSSGYPGANC